MEKRFRIVALIVSIVSLFILSNCDAVDAITGSESDDPLIETLIEITTLHPVLLNGEWGYINNKGEITIAPDYDEARDFSDGWAAVRIGTEWGYVKASTSKLEIPANFRVAGDFSNGLAPAQLPNGLYGFIDSTGAFAIEAQFDFAGAFTENLAPVRSDGLWGYVSTNGNISIQLEYSCQKFFRWYAAVETFEGWKYINPSGTVVINPGFQLAAAGDFSNGLAPIQTAEGWGYIDTFGTPIINPKFSAAGPFNDGLAWVMEDDYIGFINSDGEVVIPYQFAEVRPFSEDFAAVRLSRDWYFIHRNTGKIVFNQPFDDAESFVNGVARIQEGTGENPRYGYIDTLGEFIWFPTR